MRIDKNGNVGIGTTSPGSYKLDVNGTAHLPSIHRTSFTKELSENFELISGGGSVTLYPMLLEINVTGTNYTDQSEYAGTIDLDILAQRTNSTYGEDVIKTQLHFTAAWNEQSDAWQRLEFNQEIKAQDINSYRCIESIPEFRYKYAARKLQIFIQYNAQQYRIQHSFTARVSSDQAFAADIISSAGGTVMGTGTVVAASKGICYGTGGKLGIGITNPPAKMYVKTIGSASMGGSWNITDFVVSHGVGYNAPSQSLGVAIGVDGTGDASTSKGYLWCMRPNQTWNTLKIMGNKLELIGLSSVTLNGGASVTSDDRLKTEEEFLQNALPTIMKLKPQKYRKASFLPNDPLKATTENMSEQGDTTFIETGLIVQDIWYDAPELRDLIILGENANPSETKPVDPDPSDPTQDPDYTSWGTTSAVLNYQGVFVVALKAIQELNTDLQVEKAKVADLLARVQALENA
jgi:hypothetical protein